MQRDSPGFIETEMTHGLDDKTKDQYFSGLAIKRFGTAEEVAELAAFPWIRCFISQGKSSVSVVDSI